MFFIYLLTVVCLSYWDHKLSHILRLHFWEGTGHVAIIIIIFFRLCDFDFFVVIRLFWSWSIHMKKIILFILFVFNILWSFLGRYLSIRYHLITFIGFVLVHELFLHNYLFAWKFFLDSLLWVLKWSRILLRLIWIIIDVIHFIII